MNLYGTLFSMELNHVFLLEHKNTEQHADTKLKTQKEPHGPPIFYLDVADTTTLPRGWSRSASLI